MEIGNLNVYNSSTYLKIYSGSIYSWELSVREPLVGDYPATYRNLTSEEIAKLDDYNQDYFISEKRIVNQGFFVGYGETFGHRVIEVLTGIDIPISTLEISNDKHLFEILHPNYITRNVHVKLNELHKELDVTRVQKYLKERTAQTMEKVITSAQKDLDIMVDFIVRQAAYDRKNEEKVKCLIKQVQASWNN